MNKRLLLLLGFVLVCVTSFEQVSAQDASGMISTNQNAMPQSATNEVTFGPKKGWRFEVAPDYARVKGTYSLHSDSLAYHVSGDREGNVYGGTFSLGLPKWKDSSWLSVSYRGGELTGQNHYKGSFAPFSTSVKSDLTEVGVGFQTAAKGFIGGLSFLYQDWDTKEPGAFSSSYSDRFYLGNVDLGPAWMWTLKNGMGLGIKVDLGGGIGYADINRPDVRGGKLLLDGLGSGSVFTQWAIKGHGFGGKIFLEGGIKGSVFYAAQGGGNNQGNEQLWAAYAPFVRAGLRFDF